LPSTRAIPGRDVFYVADPVSSIHRGWFTEVDPATGRVTSVSMIKSTGHDILDNAALRALRQWRYRPRAITTFEIPIQFTTKGVIY
jgi:hypothetical protein